MAQNTILLYSSTFLLIFIVGPPPPPPGFHQLTPSPLPQAVMQLHREFLRAGSDVCQAFTFYASEDKLNNRGHNAGKHGCYGINTAACNLVRSVSYPEGALIAGGVSQTPTYLTAVSPEEVKAEVKKQLKVFKEQKVDLMIAEVSSAKTTALSGNGKSPYKIFPPIFKIPPANLLLRSTTSTWRRRSGTCMLSRSTCPVHPSVPVSPSTETAMYMAYLQVNKSFKKPIICRHLLILHIALLEMFPCVLRVI